jgi:hypothetical protein
MGGREGSALSRQESARTPVKRMMVPRAMSNALDKESNDV